MGDILKMVKSVFITGASSGIGMETAKLFASKGWTVFATMRHPENVHEYDAMKNVITYPLYVTDNDQIQKVVSNIIEKYGTVNVVVNNAGYVLLGPFETNTRDEIKQQFDVNLFGMMDVTRAWLPGIRKQHDGVIINLSSLAGLVPFAVLSMYTVTKFAVETFTETVGEEVAPFGIKMKVVEPGPTKTNFNGRSMKEGSIHISDYDQMIADYKKNSGTSASGTPDTIANLIYEAATDEKDQLHYATPEVKQMGMDYRRKEI